MFHLLLVAASAQSPTEVSEEVIIWAKPFARFDDTRWLVRSEVMSPLPAQFGTELHRVRSYGWQLEAVVHCTLDGTTKSLREADCAIEDVAVRVLVQAPKVRDNRAIEAMADSMRGAAVSLQVNERGRVPNLGIDGMSNDTVEERELADSVRTMMRQLAAAFHMDIPKENPIGAEWHTQREPLLQLTSPKAGFSSVRVVHRIDMLDGHWIQQTLGEGTSTAPARNPTAGMPCFRADGNPRCPKGPNGIPLVPEEPDTLDFDLIYKNDLNVVTVIDPERGFPVERLWSVQGVASASSDGPTYWAAGNLRLLAPEEEVSIGHSGAMAPPKKPSEHAPPWRSIATIP